MDPVISSLFPVHQIGADGFNWWIGQIESKKNQDPKNSGRYRVRIVGQHLKSCDATPSEELPWANVMMPVTTPFTDGGTTGASVNLDQGNWVIGFYIDNDKQKPIIMGSVGHTAGATLLENVEKDPNPGGDCKSFTTFLSPQRNPYKHEPLPTEEKTSGDDGGEGTENATTVGQAGLPANAVPKRHAANFYALFAENTDTNPNGGKICVEIADPKCGAENNLESNLKNIVADMLAANQQSGGQLGSFYVSKVNGELTRYADVGRYHVNRAIRLVKSLIARVKGEIVSQIREGVDYLVKTALTTDVPATDDLGNTTTGPVNPDLGIEPFSPVTKKENRLKAVQEFLDNTLGELGCSIADITDRIAAWLTDLLLGYLMDAYNAAACLIDSLVNGIINELSGLLEGLISAILGPLQEILAVLAAPLDLIGNALNKVLTLLGISCDGPESSCQKVTKECTECGTDDEDDWLDKLIDSIEDGPLDFGSVCSDAKQNPSPKKTKIVPIGGIFSPIPGSNIPGSVGNPDPIPSAVDTISYTCSDIEVVEGKRAKFIITRSGSLTYSSSITYKSRPITATYDDDYTGTVSGTIGFAPGETTKEIVFRTFRDYVTEGDEEFLIDLNGSIAPVGVISRFPEGRTFKCTIVDFQPDNFGTPDPEPIPDPPTQVVPTPVDPITPIPGTVPAVPEISVFTDKSYYYNGDKITYTIITKNVEDGTVYNYELSGDIDADDIVGDLTGTFTVQNNQSIVVRKLEQNESDDDETEILIFDVLATNAAKSVTILSGADQEYFVDADVNFVEEGESVTFTVTTSNITFGTQFSYTISGIDETDILEDLTGTAVVGDDGSTDIVVNIAGDSIEEAPELLTLSIDGTNASDTVVIIGSLGEEDPDPDAELSFAVRALNEAGEEQLEFEENDTIIYEVTTQNVPDGTILEYNLFGVDITSSDIVGGQLFGKFIVIDNTAKVYVTLAEEDNGDNIESNELMTFSIIGTGASADVIITGDIEEKDPDEPPADPCLNAPTFGAPITDSNGSIISIPIDDKGCPYQEPPKVIVDGNGYGASAIALLDDKGFVSEVRVTRTGSNYVRNLPDPNLICVIDSFTLLNPGRGYTSAPTVIINGQTGLAEARVNSDGYVYSVVIRDRSVEYYEMPEIVFEGGGGSGARVLPNIVCRDPIQLEELGYAKIGTGKYIDCP